jgi:hypothetical protein
VGAGLAVVGRFGEKVLAALCGERRGGLVVRHGVLLGGLLVL